MKSRALVPVVLLAGLAVAASPGPADSPEPAALPDLDALLARLARTASLYQDAALEFSCREMIRWSGLDAESGRQRFQYVFAQRDGRLVDYRTWPRARTEVALAGDVEPRAPRYLRSASLWAFVFKESRQPLHRYEIEGRRRVLGREAIGVRFEPRPPLRGGVNDWFGVVWVDARTTQILRVEAQDAASASRREALEAHRTHGSGGALRHDVERVVTDYTHERNGMRFPGRVRIRRWRVTAVPDDAGGTLERQPRLQVDQVYRNYRFFRIRTADEIRGIVAGTTPAPESIDDEVDGVAGSAGPDRL